MNYADVITLLSDTNGCILFGLHGYASVYTALYPAERRPRGF